MPFSVASKNFARCDYDMGMLQQVIGKLVRCLKRIRNFSPYVKGSFWLFHLPAQFLFTKRRKKVNSFLINSFQRFRMLRISRKRRTRCLLQPAEHADKYMILKFIDGLNDPFVPNRKRHSPAGHVKCF